MAARLALITFRSVDTAGLAFGGQMTFPLIPPSYTVLMITCGVSQNGLNPTLLYKVPFKWIRHKSSLSRV